MRLTREELEERLSGAFPPEQAAVLVEILDEMRRAELARAADTRELRQGLTRLTEEVRALAEAQRRTEERVEQLAQAQRRTEERLEELAEAQRRTEARVEQLAEAQRQTEARLQRLEATVQELAQAQRRTEARLEELAEAQRRTEESLRELAQAQRRTEEQLEGLLRWQRGEAGRREGERYERLIGKRAPALFHGGEGGPTDRSSVQRRLADRLAPVLTTRDLADDENPFLADLIWWKDNRFLVVEASLQVNGRDVVRAARRAETLREAGVEATGVVVGEEWAGPDVRRQAEARGVEWKVGDDLSEGLLAFRRMAT